MAHDLPQTADLAAFIAVIEDGGFAEAGRRLGVAPSTLSRTVTRLEARSVRANRLVEERSRALLRRAFSRVFSHLQNMDPHFDFDAAVAPVPIAIWGDPGAMGGGQRGCPR